MSDGRGERGVVGRGRGTGRGSRGGGRNTRAGRSVGSAGRSISNANSMEVDWSIVDAQSPLANTSVSLRMDVTPSSQVSGNKRGRDHPPDDEIVTGVAGVHIDNEPIIVGNLPAAIGIVRDEESDVPLNRETPPREALAPRVDEVDNTLIPRVGATARTLAQELRTGNIGIVNIPNPPQFSNVPSAVKISKQYCLIAYAGNEIFLAHKTFKLNQIHEMMEKYYRRACDIYINGAMLTERMGAVPGLTISDLLHASKITQGGRPLLSGEQLWRRFCEFKTLVHNVLNANWELPTSGQTADDSLYHLKVSWYRHEHKDNEAIPPEDWEPKEWQAYKSFGLPISLLMPGVK